VYKLQPARRGKYTVTRVKWSLQVEHIVPNWLFGYSTGYKRSTGSVLMIEFIQYESKVDTCNACTSSVFGSERVQIGK